jgi:hypothetical protein
MPKATYSQDINFTSDKLPAWAGISENSLFADIDASSVDGGVHAKIFGYHRSLSKRFPFAIYYRVEANTVRVHAVLDCRRRPSWIRRTVGDR